jgi:hypothetical protein
VFSRIHEFELSARRCQVGEDPVAKTHEGRRAATVYLDKEALHQLQKIAFDEETTIQTLLAEGVNTVFAARDIRYICV